jgi:hypothetical protein
MIEWIDFEDDPSENYTDYLRDVGYLLYHPHQSHIQAITLTDDESAEIIEYNSMGRNLADRNLWKNQKKVILHNDPDFSNGLPRRRI